MMWKFSNNKNNAAIYTDDGNIIDYQALLDAQEKLVAKIPGRCLTFNLCSNTPGSLLGYVSFLNHRIVPFLVESELDRELLGRLIVDYKPDYIWCPAEKVESFSEYKEVYSIWSYSLLKTPYNNVYPLYPDLALLLTTSGSTGSPKLVKQSYSNILSNTQSIVEYLSLDSNERPITTLPMSYTYGLSILNTHLYVGASVIMTEKTMMQREFWQQFKAYGATSFGGVPYNYEMLEKLRFFRMDLPSLKTMTQAGGKLSPELHKRFAEYAEENNKRFIVMYGQTEATARMAYLPASQAIEKYGSMGIPIPGGSFYLIDESGNRIAKPDHEGELVYEGKNVTLGYAEHGEDLIKGDERNGVLITGDMAKYDNDGFFYIVGRKKRFLKIFGSRINLDEVERMFKAEYPEIDCAIAGVDDKLYLFVLDDYKKEHIIKFLSDKTKLNLVAFKVIKVDHIPRSDSGKVLYQEFNRFYNV